VLAILALVLVGTGIIAVVLVNGGGNSGTRRNGLPARSVDNPKDPYYVVQTGDSFSTIAVKEGVGEALIRRLNPNLDPLDIQPENCVDLIPHGCRRLAGRSSVGHAPNGPKDPYYVVRVGDNLSAIAAAEGVTLARLTRLNPRLHPNSIQPGNCIDLVRSGCRELAALKSAARRPPSIDARIGPSP
jgi:LysM repeat protein